MLQKIVLSLLLTLSSTQALAYPTLGDPLFAQPSEEIPDPSKPTNLYTAVDGVLEWSRFKDSHLFATRFLPAFSPNPQNIFLAEIPVPMITLSDKGKVSGGIGDIRFRYFGLPYVDQDAPFFTHAGLSIDVLAPTGDAAQGFGYGRWFLVPGFLMGLKILDNLQLYPNLSYLYAAPDKDSQATGGSHGLNVSLLATLNLPSNMWLQLLPSFSQSLAGPNLTQLNAQISWGMMVDEHLGFYASFMHEFIAREFIQEQVRLGSTYIF